MTAVQWLVLDNLKSGWIYTTNINRGLAEEAYIQCVRNEWVTDGRINHAGERTLLVEGRNLEK